MTLALSRECGPRERECHIGDTRNRETDRSPVISSCRSSNVSRIRWRNWTLYMIIEFIMQIQQCDGSKCYKKLGRVLILEGFYIDLYALEGLSSDVSQRRLFRCYLVIVSMLVVRRMSSLSCGLLERVTRALEPWWRELQINYLVVLIIIRYYI